MWKPKGQIALSDLDDVLVFSDSSGVWIPSFVVAKQVSKDIGLVNNEIASLSRTCDSITFRHARFKRSPEEDEGLRYQLNWAAFLIVAVFYKINPTQVIIVMDQFNKEINFHQK